MWSRSLAWVEDEYLLKRHHLFPSDDVSMDLQETMIAAGLADIDVTTDTLKIFPLIHKAAAADAVVLGEFRDLRSA